MIKSLYQINTALSNLTKCLQSPTSLSSLQVSIDNLLSEVKYLDQQQKSKYYYLISQIYATKFQNIPKAQEQLSLFDSSLNTEIYMNCEIRYAFYQYFQQNYAEANKHLVLGLGYVEEELKLSKTARFFLNRVINKENLQLQSKLNKNFQAAFILSIFYQYQKQQISSLKLIESFLEQQNHNKFQIFQIYKRLIQLYDEMKKKSISTISISKKSLEIYKQELANLMSRNTQFQQDYNLKCEFIKKIIEFMGNENMIRNKNQKIIKRMLDLKLLSYYKLKKCSKFAPNKQIKLTLMNSAKMIKQSKNSQFLEETLNYDFVKKQYDIYKVIYKHIGKEDLLKWQFFNNLANYSPRKPTKSILKSTKSFAYEPNMKQFTLGTNNNKKIHAQNSQKQVPSSFKQNPQKNIFLNQQQQQPNRLKQTASQIFDQQFQGSIMIKINASSQGYQQRYFYVKNQSLKQNPRLYYCQKANKKNNNDSYYSLKGLKQIQIGKQTKAFQRKQTAKFSPGQCFSLIFNQDKQRNFYVPNKIDFQKWLYLIQTKIIGSVPDLSNMKNTTIGFSKAPTSTKIQNKQSIMKKSRKIVQI